MKAIYGTGNVTKFHGLFATYLYKIHAIYCTQDYASIQTQTRACNTSLAVYRPIKLVYKATDSAGATSKIVYNMFYFARGLLKVSIVY